MDEHENMAAAFTLHIFDWFTFVFLMAAYVCVCVLCARARALTSPKTNRHIYSHTHIAEWGEAKHKAEWKPFASIIWTGLAVLIVDTNTKTHSASMHTHTHIHTQYTRTHSKANKSCSAWMNKRELIQIKIGNNTERFRLGYIDMYDDARQAGIQTGIRIRDSLASLLHVHIMG